jgi:LysM repeat protein
MRRIIFVLLLSFSTAAVHAQAPAAAAQPIELAPDAPDRHIVVPGDTLWGIAAKFLKDPFRWPDVWKMNTEQVKNPHRIYPGQVVILDRSGNDPQLKLGTVVKLSPEVREKGIAKEISAIPSQAIEPFLSQPLVIDPAQFQTAPRIVATQESRVYTANGDLIYASGVNPRISLWQIYRPGKPLIDPDSQEPLGVEAVYLGNARTVSSAGDITTLEVTVLKQEIGRGDYLVPASRPEVISYMPHLPTQPILGRIMTLYGGVGEGGPNSIVTISRGARDGIERGHVLALYRAGATVTNRFIDDQPQSHLLPDERYGMLFVFRIFDRVSYALVVESSRSVMPGDRVAPP